MTGGTRSVPPFTTANRVDAGQPLRGSTRDADQARSLLEAGLAVDLTGRLVPADEGAGEDEGRRDAQLADSAIEQRPFGRCHVKPQHFLAAQVFALEELVSGLLADLDLAV